MRQEAQSNYYFCRRRGDRAPGMSICRATYCCVGAEREGVSKATLDASDYMLDYHGWICPILQFQVAVSVLTVEALKQRIG